MTDQPMQSVADQIRAKMAECFAEDGTLPTGKMRTILAYRECLAITESIEPKSDVVNELREAAQAVIDRWDTPKWKDAAHTGDFINRLRRAVDAIEAAERAKAGE